MTTELSRPKGHGLVRVAHNLRLHVFDPRDWGHGAGTDFWLFCGNSDMLPGGGEDLATEGWAASGFSHAVGSGADLLSSSGLGTTGGFNFDAAGDLLDSPSIFGDYVHGLMAGQILGHFPTSLNMECYARFAANNNETASGFGFIQDGGSPPTAADALAFIHTDGTDFALRSSGATDTGDTDDTTAHQFKITLSGTTAEWFIDGTSQGTIALLEDQFPVSWGASTVSGGANDPVIAFVHIWYE